jgi:hypothetical protein
MATEGSARLLARIREVRAAAEKARAAEIRRIASGGRRQ